MPPIPVVDVFAGPGGLAEGFSSLYAEGEQVFDITLSVEKDPDPFNTLRLRAFFRQFQPCQIPEDYYRLLRGEISQEELFGNWPEQAAAAEHSTWRATLGQCDLDELDTRIAAARDEDGHWVLVGGPPCQAFSCAGIVGNRTRNGYTLETDGRSYLYREFIRILALHAPAAFVMENVPGMLFARLNGTKVMEKVLRGLFLPGDFVFNEFGIWPDAPRYRLISLTSGIQGLGCDPRSFVVRAEDFGLPQARHRIIIVGIREDLDPQLFPLPERNASVPVDAVIDDLPALRSTLSRETDTLLRWRRVFSRMGENTWVKQVNAMYGGEFKRLILTESVRIQRESPGESGAEFLPCAPQPAWNPQWYTDARLGGACHHFARPHIRSDLHRYLFCACFGEMFGRSPKLSEFPEGLLPDHRNAQSGNFKDRFRVLLRGRPAGTVISHLAKDGHAFIHPDRAQCRSITPREAARIQTFPDNYLFTGSRASQFRQIGNAVPPLLARYIAESLASVFPD